MLRIDVNRDTITSCSGRSSSFGHTPLPFFQQFNCNQVKCCHFVDPNYVFLVLAKERQSKCTQEVLFEARARFWGHSHFCEPPITTSRISACLLFPCFSYSFQPLVGCSLSRSDLQVKEPAPCRDCHRVRAISGSEFAHNVSKMNLDGLLGDKQFLTDIPVALPVSDVA
jgi:hypothetical protein